MAGRRAPLRVLSCCLLAATESPTIGLIARIRAVPTSLGPWCELNDGRKDVQDRTSRITRPWTSVRRRLAPSWYQVKRFVIEAGEVKNGRVEIPDGRRMDHGAAAEIVGRAVS